MATSPLRPEGLLISVAWTEKPSAMAGVNRALRRTSACQTGATLAGSTSEKLMPCDAERRTMSWAAMGVSTRGRWRRKGAPRWCSSRKCTTVWSGSPRDPAS